MSDDFGQTPGTAGTLVPDPNFPEVSFRTATIETAGDEDWFGVNLVAGRTYNFYVTGAPSGLGTLADPLLKLYDSSGVLINSNDNYFVTESYIRFVAPSTGTFFLGALAVGAGTGSYTVIAADLGVLGPNDFYGTRYADLLTGTTSNDTIIGFNGADTIVADAGDDLIYGGDAGDSIEGDADNDTIYGDAGADTIDGGDGDDVIYAGSDSSDTVRGGAGVDRVVLSSAGFSFNLFSDPGLDFGLTSFFGSPNVTFLKDVEIFELSTGTQFELLLTPNGAGQSVAASRGFRTLAVGGNGDDTIVGSDVAGRDYLYGGFGQDTLTGGAGADWFDSFFGSFASIDGDVITDFQNDDMLIIRVDFGRQHVTFSQQLGQLLIEIDSNLDATTDATVTLLGDFSAVIPEFSVNNYAPGFTVISFAIQELFGTPGADTLVGDGGDDLISGLEAADSLSGLAGNDTLLGGAGADSLDGGADSDTLSYATSAGSVAVNLSINTAAYGDAAGDVIQNFEHLIGGAGNDTLTGSNGANTIDGGDGIDLIKGGLGADNLNGGAGVDTVDYSDATAKVTVRLWNQTATGSLATGDVIAGFENARGGSAGDAIVGSDAVNNRLVGNGGADVLQGLSGNDTLEGNAGNDTLKGGAGADVLSGGTDVDTVDYSDSSSGVKVRLWNQSASDGLATGDVIAGIENVIGGASTDALVGSDGVANLLSGNGGNDNVQGRSGNDTLIGGAGADTLTGGADNDTFEFAGAFGIDRITDFQGGAGAGDVIRLVGLGPAFDSFAEVMAVTSQSGLNTIINFGPGLTITLLGFNMANLNADDFLFS